MLPGTRALRLGAVSLVLAGLTLSAAGDGLVFEPNRGQAGPRAAFYARARDYFVEFYPSGGAQFRLLRNGARSDLRMRLLNTSGPAAFALEQPSGGVVNYYAGSDPSGWITSVPCFDRLRFQQVYPGVDVVYKQRDRNLEMEIHVEPGARPAPVAFQFHEARRLYVDRHGALVAETSAGLLRFRRPLAYQPEGERRRLVRASYAVAGAVVRFRLGPYDRSRPLVIDPVVTFSTYFGGGSTDVANAVAASASAVYLAGEAWSADLPAASGSRQNRDAFVTRLSADGKSVVYTTILSGGGMDTARAIAVDGADNAYVAGITAGQNFPVTAGALRTLFGGADDGFAVKLGPTGQIVFSTYLGSPGPDAALGIGVDSDGNAYVTGYAGAGGFPTSAGAPQTVYRGGTDAFLIKLNAAGNALMYGTLFGGARSDMGRSVAVNAGREACIGGSTDSADLTLNGSLQPRLSGTSDALIACLNAAGTTWTLSSYLGGSGSDEAAGVAFANDSELYVAGSTLSWDFPITAGTVGSLYTAGWDGFVTKVSVPARTMLWATFLGGSGTDAVLGVAVDSAGQAWITGHTESANFPQKNASQVFGGNIDAFITGLNPGATDLAYSSFVGGGYDDRGYGIAVSPANGVYAAGLTMSSNFPVTSGVVRTSLGGAVDGFVTAIPAVLPVRGDFDGNGRTDILLQYKPTSDIALWYMGGADGKQIQAFEWIHQGGLNGWNLVGAADFDNNGKPDIVWQHDASFDAGLWHMTGSDGRQWVRFAWLAQGDRAGWRLATVADMDGNGKPDLLWQNTTTYQSEIWYMGGSDGTQKLAVAPLSPQSGSDWRLAGSGDFDADGKVDLVWQSEGARQVVLWYMTGANGSQYRSMSWLSSSGVWGWRVYGCADLDRNGKPDLLWQHDSTNQAAVWYMQGAQGNQFWYSAWLDPNGSPGWRIVVP